MNSSYIPSRIMKVEEHLNYSFFIQFFTCILCVWWWDIFFFALMYVKCHFVFHFFRITFFRQDKEFGNRNVFFQLLIFFSLIFCFFSKFHWINILESWINNFHTNKTCTTTSDCPQDDSSTNQYHYKCDLVLNQCVWNGLSFYYNQSTTTTNNNNNNANRKNYHNNDNQTFLSNNRNYYYQINNIDYWIKQWKQFA